MMGQRTPPALTLEEWPRHAVLEDFGDKYPLKDLNDDTIQEILEIIREQITVYKDYLKELKHYLLSTYCPSHAPMDSDFFSNKKETKWGIRTSKKAPANGFG